MILIILYAYVHFLTVTATLKCLFLWLVILIILILTVVTCNTGKMCSSLFLTCILQNGLTQVVTRDNNCIDFVMVSDV